MHGRTIAHARYLVMKAKLSYATEVHHALIEELRAARAEESRARMEKDNVLNEVLHVTFGLVLLSPPLFLPD